MAPPASLKMRIIGLTAILLPFAGFIAACVLAWGNVFDWTYLVLMIAMYFVTTLGVTIGFHRLYTHKAFQTYKPIAFLFGVMGSMSAQGPLMHWVAEHRRHHQHSDDQGDPHSPHGHGDTAWGMIRGAIHAHMGWLFRQSSRNLASYVKDLKNDRAARTVSRQFFLWVIAGLVIPAILGGLLTMSWTGVALGFLWGGLARMFLVHHVTWSINSVCHIWGWQPFESHDHSRNNPFMGILAMGEGWHNNHHAFPTSARHGLQFWQFDLSYYIIRGLQAIGLAWQVRLPARDRMAAKMKKA